MLFSLPAAGVAAALVFTAVPADAATPAPVAAPTSTPATAVAPNWYQLWVGEHYEEHIDPYDEGRAWTYSVAPHSLLPKGLQLDEKTGVVSGVPEEEIVQLTTFIVVDDETGAERQHYVFFRVDNPVIGEPVPELPGDPEWPLDPEWPIDG